MTQPECPSAVASKRSSLPKTLQEYMRKYLILRPPLDPRYFVQDHENQLHLTESPPQNIVLSRYVEGSKQLSSLYQAAPCPRRTFCAQMFSREDEVMSQHSDDDSPMHQSPHPDIPQQPPNIEQSSPFSIKEEPSHSESDFEECNHCEKAPCSTPEGSIETSSILSTSTPETSSSILTSRNPEFQTVDTTMEVESNSMGRRLREKTHLFTKENLLNMANTWQYRNKIGVKRDDRKEIPKSNPKRIKTSKAVDTRTSTDDDDDDDTPLQFTELRHMAFSPKPLDIEVTASTPIVKKQSLDVSSSGLTDSSKPGRKRYLHWTKRETKYLEDGFERFGSQWSLILRNYKFNPSRNAQHLRSKYRMIHPGYARIRQKVAADNETDDENF